MKLYKFRYFDCKGYHLDALKSKKVWFPSRAELNDPFEGYSDIEIINSSEISRRIMINLGKRTAISRGLASNLHEAEELVLQRYLSNPDSFNDFSKGAIQNFIKELQDSRDMMGIFCSSMEKDSPYTSPIGNMPMWAHYSDSFTGFCLEFDKKLLLNSLRELNSGIDFEGAVVQYSNKPYTIAPEYINDIDRISLDFLRAIQVKSNQWKSENEYRIVSTKTGGFEYSLEALTSVLYPENINTDNKRQLLEVISKEYPNAAVKEVRVVRGNKDFYLQAVTVS